MKKFWNFKKKIKISEVVKHFLFLKTLIIKFKIILLNEKFFKFVLL